MYCVISIRNKSLLCGFWKSFTVVKYVTQSFAEGKTIFSNQLIIHDHIFSFEKSNNENFSLITLQTIVVIFYAVLQLPRSLIWIGTEFYSLATICIHVWRQFFSRLQSIIFIYSNSCLRLPLIWQNSRDERHIFVLRTKQQTNRNHNKLDRNEVQWNPWNSESILKRSFMNNYANP